MRFYITTPIFYVNDVPHVGHSYTTVVADVLRRYHRLFGHDTLLLTGVDEHGQKVQTAAEKRGLSPQAHCDEMQKNFRAIWEELGIDYDIFFRTTDEFHKKAVQKCLQELWDKGEIYSEEYEGWYSVSEETFFTEKDLVNGKTPQGNDVTLLKEKNFFFRMGKYQERLIKHIESNPNFIQPDAKRNEVLGFLRQPLNDLCISRPKARMSWGIELPFAPDYVTYVWFDALLNYATGVGYQQPERAADFKKWWTENPPVHLIGKDILIPHTVYWPTMLMALGISLPKQVFAHGWWLSASGDKMSKSKGNVIKPLDVKNIVGIDAFRYFLTRDIVLGNDSAFSPELVVTRVNAELANNFGNLASRVTNIIEKSFAGQAPEVAKFAPESEALLAKTAETAEKVKAAILAMAPQDAVDVVVALLTDANKYVGDRAPWKQVKEDMAGAADTLYTALEVLRVAAILLSPIMPGKCAQLLEQIGYTGEPNFADAQKVKLTKAGAPVRKGEILFPRVDWKADA